MDALEGTHQSLDEVSWSPGASSWLLAAYALSWFEGARRIYGDRT